MKGVRVLLGSAQKAKEILNANRLLADYKIVKEKNFITFPVKNTARAKKLVKNAEIIEKKFEKNGKPETLRNALGKRLAKEELKILKTSFDVVGTIAILEIEAGLDKRKKLLAETLMKINPKIKTVLKKAGSHGGIFRTRKLEFLAGEDTRETIHRENGVSIKINVETVYFSSRLSTERKRIAELVKPNEKVLVMFSGAGPYVCVIAKKTRAKEVVGIEINPEGHRYAMENLILNKIKNARLYLGDVKEVVPKLNEKFDRILMPLPKSAEDFLDIALSASKKGTVVHFYDFLEEKDIPQRAVEKIENACKRNNLKCKILGWVKCGQNAPRNYRVCVDFEVG
jgi:tRNA (guanine37-N1)-methyltransferase